MFNHGFWERHFRDVYIPRLNQLIEVLELRLLPVFEHAQIDAEAEAQSEEAWQKFNSTCGPDGGDPADFAERAMDLGITHYVTMLEIRQSLLNLFASALYHTWEQHLLQFHRREVLTQAEEHINKLLEIKEVERRLAKVGIKISSLPSWGKVDELRLIANVVKHADGSSGDQLKEIRPDLFKLRDIELQGLESFSGGIPRVYTPLSGRDLYVDLETLKEYKVALVSFWTEFANVISSV